MEAGVTEDRNSSWLGTESLTLTAKATNEAEIEVVGIPTKMQYGDKCAACSVMQ